MKIIGTAGNGDFILTADENELAKICGFYGANAFRQEDKPKIGKQICVSDLYAALAVSRERKEDITKLANGLRSLAGKIDSINQALAAPIIEVAK